MLIRDATDDDWPRIHPFFRVIVEAGETYAYPPGMTSEEARGVWMDGSSRVAVAVDTAGDEFDGAGDQQILGSAKMGPNRPARGSHIATAGFMVSPAARGRGVGRALGGEMISWASRAGYRGIQFNAVVETNTSAVLLWQSLGFEILTTVPGAFDHPTRGFVGLHVMFRSLLPAT